MGFTIEIQTIFFCGVQLWLILNLRILQQCGFSIYSLWYEEFVWFFTLLLDHYCFCATLNPLFDCMLAILKLEQHSPNHWFMFMDLGTAGHCMSWGSPRTLLLSWIIKDMHCLTILNALEFLFFRIFRSLLLGLAELYKFVFWAYW